MKILRGLFHLSCQLPAGGKCPKGFTRDCKHGCFDCNHARAVAVSLEGKEVCEIKSAEFIRRLSGGQTADKKDRQKREANKTE